MTTEESFEWFSTFMVMFLIGIGGLLFIACMASVATGEPSFYTAVGAFAMMFYLFIAGYVTRAIHMEVKK